MKKILLLPFLIAFFWAKGQDSANLQNTHRLEKRYDSTNTPKYEFVQYTDFLGFGNDNPNGLLQQKFLFKWPLIKDEWKIKKTNIIIQPLRSVLLPSILFNRIEKGKDSSSFLYPVGYSIRQIDSVTRDTAISPVVGTFDLMRYTSLKIETRIVLLSILVDKTRIYFDWQGGLIRNKILDTASVKKEKHERFIYSYASGFSVYVKSLLDEKRDLNIEVEAGFNKIKLLDNFFKQFDVYQTDNTGKKAIAFPVEKYNRDSNPIYYGSITLRKDWGKDSSKNKNSGFFKICYHYQKGDFRYYQKTSPGRVISDSFYNHFLQLQLGISLDLEKIFDN